MTKNLITFKMGWGLKMKNLILWGFTEKGGGGTKNQYIGGIA